MDYAKELERIRAKAFNTEVQHAGEPSMNLLIQAVALLGLIISAAMAKNEMPGKVLEAPREHAEVQARS